MPTDGADFGKMKACYGRAYTAVRSGMGFEIIADSVVRGVEREIRRDGGAPVFLPAVELIATFSQRAPQECALQFLQAIDSLSIAHRDSPLTRQVLDVATKAGLDVLYRGAEVSKHESAKRLLGGMARSRCDAMSGYATRHRTHSAAGTQELLSSVHGKIASSSELDGLAGRMLRPTAKGLPERAAKGPRIVHSLEVLNSISLEGGS